MRSVLKLHPKSRCTAVTGLEVTVLRTAPSALVLRYVVTGAIGDLRLPPLTVSARTDGLWQHTCFEAFLRAPRGDSYYEFNFAPSSQWAAYSFNAYRAGMAPVQEVSVPRIEARASGPRYALSVALELSGVPDLPPAAAWRLGLSAVIEETNGRKSYWALAHPPGKADFHHPDCFAGEVPPA